MTPLSRRQFLKGSSIAAASLVGAGAAQGYAGAQLNTHRARLSGLQRPLRLTLLADLHYGRFIGLPQVRAWVTQALSTRPDAFLLLGDYVDVKLWEAMPEALLNELGRLQAPLGTYGVWGNHDYGSFGRYERAISSPQANWLQVREQFKAAFGQRGIRILREEGVLLRPDMYLGGVDDVWWGQPDYAAALRDAPSGSAKVLLSHNPDYLMKVPPDIGLMLSGHTHGGQVRLPFIGAPVVPSAYGQRLAQGWVSSDNGARGFVSRGLGMSGLPLRNLCPPEVVVLELSG